MKIERPNVVFANSVNLSGLYSTEPIRCMWDDSLEEWYDSEGNFNATKLGERDSGGHITFASESESEVKAWTEGARAVMRMLQRWSEEDIEDGDNEDGEN